MNFKKSIGWLIVIVIVFSCQKVPITGRNQLHIIPESELISLSVVQYKETLQQSKIVTGTADAALVNKVGKKIADAAVSLMNQQGESDRLKGFAWEYHLLEDKMVNAMVLALIGITCIGGMVYYVQVMLSLSLFSYNFLRTFIAIFWLSWGPYYILRRIRLQ